MVRVASAITALSLAACGRIDFAAQPDAASNAPIPPSPPTIPIALEAHHVGDNVLPVPPMDPEGLTFSRAFDVPDTCTRGVLDINFPGPYGPYKDQLPIASINGTMLPSLQPEFPPDTDPRWSTDGNYDNNPPLLVSIDATSTFHTGANVFRLDDGSPTDDFLFDGVQLRCF